MRRQRNNIATCLAPDARELVCKLLYEGCTKYSDIAAAVAKGWPKAPKLHNGTFGAYQRSQEYKDYVAAQRKWDDKLKSRRWASAIINNGKGPQNLADMAELAILEQLHSLAEGGLLETGKDVATVARAITSMQRTQLARATADQAAEIARLREELTAKDAKHAEALAALQAEIAKLRGGEAGKPGGLSPAALKEIEQKAKLL